MKKLLCLLLFAVLTNLASAFAQVVAANPWQFIEEQTLTSVNPENRRIIPKKFLTARIEPQEMRDFLQNAPLWFTDEAKEKEVVLALPMPDGTFEDFRIELAPVMHRDLQKKFPEIQAYAGVGITDPHAYLRFDMTPVGFHAMVMSPRHSDVFIDPYSTEDNRNYLVYFKKDFSKENEWTCSTESEEVDVTDGGGDVANRMAGDCILRNYALALACTGEYATFHGGTVTSVMSAMTTSMVRVNGVYEKDLSVHMDMVPNNNLLVYLNAATDPYTNGSGSAMLGENQTTCDGVIGNANYDIGHVFSTGGGGVAYLGCVCNSSNKAGGVTGQTNPIGDPFDIDYVAHEMGHQFGANHTQNNNCNRVASASFEPGSASTIMGYAGICSPNVQNNSDAYFHAHSLAEIATEIASGGGGSCSTNQTINTAPTANAGADYVIPKSTPFVLTGISSDPNETGLTHCWEQMDNAVATMPPVSTNTGGPTFRSLTAVTSPSRYFPNLPAIIANTTPTWEVLPSVGRTLNFRFTVRDNKVGGGCTKEDNMVVTVNGTAGPFLVTTPNVAGISWPGLSTQTVTWDVAGTTAAPVSCANVNILLSLDGGNTYPITLASAVPNDGSHDVVIPDNQTSTARIMVRGASNVFFDISNVNFTISAPLNDFTFDVSPNTLAVCQPTSAVFSVNIGWAGSFSGDVTLAATGIPAGATHSFSVNPMTSPGTSLLTISNLPAGNFAINVSATGSTGTKNETVGLTVSATAAAAPTLTLPADAATGVAVLPTFTWAASLGAFTYDLQVSTSNTFANTVINQTGLSGTTYVATTALTANTQYFWRVRAINACGNGDWSTVFSFTTVNITCTTFASTDVPKTISATGTPTVTSVLNLTTLGTVQDINLVNLNITHSYINDLIVKLKSPANTERTMFSQICGSQNNVITNFDDEATLLYSQLPCPPTGNLFYQPLQTLSQFDNENTNGTWTLTVQDVANSDGGTLNSWSLAVCYTPTTVPVSVTIAPINVACFGGATGSATATATGGTGSYTYAWSNGATTAAITSLVAGVYTVTATSGAQSATASVTISQPASAVSVSISKTDVACFGGATGLATATAIGGTGSKTYLWSNGGSTATISNLVAGVYTCTATDANGCTATASTTISQPASAVALSASSTNATCGSSNGSATATASGGTAPYTHLWSNGGNTQTINNLAAGTYTCTATDANGCTKTATATVAQSGAPSVSISSVNVSCFGGSNGSATATATAGAAPYTYAWSTAATTAAISSLTAGIYTCTATDANGCTATASTTISQPTAVSVSISKNDVACFGGATGSATATATGGTGSKTYAWSNGATTATISNLTAGVYTCTATDANGCTATASTTISQPASAVSVSISSNNATCGNSNGSATATATGGTAPHTYTWSNGGNSQTINSLAAGTYTCTTTDATGCTATASATISQSPAVSLSISKTNVSCFGGSNGTATAAASGGTAPISFSWSNGSTTVSISNLTAGVYTCTATDANGCTATASATITQPALGVSVSTSGTNVTCLAGSNGSATATATGGSSPYTYAWSNGGNTQTINNLTAGTYTCTATDANGCTATATRVVTQPATGISLSYTYTLPLCFGDANGKIRAIPTGGTTPYTYLWSNGQTVQTATNLAAGSYFVTVTGKNGCTMVGNPVLNNPPLLVITGVSSQLLAAGYRVTVTAEGGTGAKKYRRSTGATTWTAWQTSRIFSGLTAGTYTFQVQDAKLCTASFTTPVPVSAPPLQPTNGSSSTVFAKNNVSKMDFQLAPNPTREAVRLIFENENLPETGFLEIRDATGKLVLRERFENVQANAGWLEISDLPSGVFLLTLRAGDFAPATRKLVVE